MTAPVHVDNVTLDDTTDFDAFVHDVLRGGGGVGSSRSDNAPLDWIFRAYEQLRDTPYADRMSRGVAACLDASDPDVQTQALVFFQSQPRAVGGERIDDLVAGDRARFAGVADPMHPSVDLEWQLLVALGARLRGGGARTLGLARTEALKPGKAHPFIGALTAAAPDWVVEHAEDIVRGTPAAGIPILVKLQALKRDLAAVGRRIAPLCHGDPQFESYVTRLIDAPGTRQILLDAFRSAGN
jgi:hypothetical protein